MNHERSSDQTLRDVRALATLLDSKFSVLGFKFGLDGLLGLIPVVGDVVTSLMSLYILGLAASVGCSASTLMRMGLNIAFENLVDMIPVAGNIFDFFYKSNTRNLRLLEAHMHNPRAVTRSSRAVLAALIVAILCTTAALC